MFVRKVTLLVLNRLFVKCSQTEWQYCKRKDSSITSSDDIRMTDT